MRFMSSASRRHAMTLAFPTGQLSGRSPWVLSLIAAIAIPLLLQCPVGQASTRQDSRLDGVPCVQNSSQPAHGAETIKLSEVWRVRGEEITGSTSCRITSAQSGPEGNIYLLEPSRGVIILSATGELVRMLEPQLQHPSDRTPVLSLMIAPEGTMELVQMGCRRVVSQTLDGTVDAGPLYEDFKGCPEPGVSIFDGQRRGSHLALAGKLVVVVSPNDTSMTSTTFLSRFPLEDEHRVRYEEVRYHESRNKYSIDSPGKIRDYSCTHFSEHDEYFPAPDRWALGHDGRVFVVPFRDEYEIWVHTREGRLERVIRRDFRSPKRSPHRLALIRGAWDEAVGDKACDSYELCDTDPAIRRIWVDDDGMLWVLHARSALNQPEGILHSYDVFDSTGVLAKQVAIACDGDGESDALFFLDANRIFRVTGALDPLLIVPQGIGHGPYGGHASPSEIVCYQVIH